MKDRRKVKRRYLLYYVRVYNTISREQIGNLVDITSAGAMILSEKPITQGDPLTIKIELSGDVADKSFMELAVRTIWCHPDIDPRLFNIGVRFEEVSPEDKSIIQNIIKIYGFRDNKVQDVPST